MTQEQPELQAFVDECIEEYYKAPYEEETTRLSADTLESIMFLLVYEGLRLCLPELREWLRLGASVIALKRLEIEKKLKEYAEKKELPYQEAEKAAKAVANGLNEENVDKVVKALESTIR